ncbi:hypothetical protein [Psychrobacter frigidicola]|nr:hypothetical protein [Psychrobacter frigidicola]
MDKICEALDVGLSDLFT